jgi:hypothetical protein
MDTKLVIVLTIIIVIIVVFYEVILLSLFRIHRMINKRLRYGYTDNKTSDTGFWTDDQRKTHETSQKLKEKLYDNGAIYASMSGSGSSVFGLFKEINDLKNQFEGNFYFSCTL